MALYHVNAASSICGRPGVLNAQDFELLKLSRGILTYLSGHVDAEKQLETSFRCQR